jgi:hypothetical protein
MDNPKGIPSPQPPTAAPRTDARHLDKYQPSEVRRVGERPSIRGHQPALAQPLQLASHQRPEIERGNSSNPTAHRLHTRTDWKESSHHYDTSKTENN